MSTNDRDPAAGIAAQCAGNRYDNKQWRQANGRIYAGIHFVDPAHHSSRNEALCLPDSEEGRGRSRKRNAAAPFAQRIRELLFTASVVGHAFVVHGFGPVVIFIGEDRYRKSRAIPPYGYVDNSRAGAMQAPYAAPCRGK